MKRGMLILIGLAALALATEEAQRCLDVHDCYSVEDDGEISPDCWACVFNECTILTDQPCHDASDYTVGSKCAADAHCISGPSIVCYTDPNPERFAFCAGAPAWVDSMINEVPAKYRETLLAQVHANLA